MSLEFPDSIEKLKGHSGRMARFGAVGVGNVTTEFLVFGALLHFGVLPVVANAGSFLCANIQSYVVNAHVTFRQDGRRGPISFPAYGRFFLAHCLSLAISTSFIVFLGPHIGLFVAKAAAIGFGFVANYTMSSIFVFQRAAKNDVEKPTV
jgi:putative flippase GtrA